MGFIGIFEEQFVEPWVNKKYRHKFEYGKSHNKL